MTTLPDRPGTALVVIDVQRGVVAEALDRDATVANIARLVERARERAVPVVWIQHADAQLERDSEAWEIVPELAPAEGEPVVGKSYGDAFEETELESVLADRGVGRLVVSGAESGDCVRATLHGAFVRGYDAPLVSDAHTCADATAWGAPPPEQVRAFVNFVWTHETAPGRTAGTATTAEVEL